MNETIIFIFLLILQQSSFSQEIFSVEESQWLRDNIFQISANTFTVQLIKKESILTSKKGNKIEPKLMYEFTTTPFLRVIENADYNLTREFSMDDYYSKTVRFEKTYWLTNFNIKKIHIPKSKRTTLGNKPKSNMTIEIHILIGENWEFLSFVDLVNAQKYKLNKFDRIELSISGPFSFEGQKNKFRLLIITDDYQFFSEPFVSFISSQQINQIRKYNDLLGH